MSAVVGQGAKPTVSLDAMRVIANAANLCHPGAVTMECSSIGDEASGTVVSFDRRYWGQNVSKKKRKILDPSISSVVDGELSGQM